MYSKSKKDRKRDRTPEPDMIEMEDLAHKPLPSSEVNINETDTQSEVNVEYPQLSESQVNSPGKQTNQQANQRQQQQPPTQLPQYPGPQYKPQPNPVQQGPPPSRDSSIRMNGMVFQGQNQAQQVEKKRSRVPDMYTISQFRTVHCKWCTLSQIVAGNSHIFICTACDNMNECRPIYNLFVCYGCHTQVCYQLGVSQMIRCTRCRTVNRVPLVVSPNYSREQTQQMQRQQQQRHQQQQRNQQRRQEQPPLYVPPQVRQQPPPKKQVKEAVHEEEIILLEEPPVEPNDRYHTQKREYVPQQPDLLEFDEESWQEPIQEQKQLLNPKQPTNSSANRDNL